MQFWHGNLKKSGGRMNEFEKRLDKLEYHQQLILRMIGDTEMQLYYLIINKNLSRKETEELLNLCDNLNKEIEKQKAEGYVTFNPLLIELKSKLMPSITPGELIQACLKQGVYISLMKELQKSL